MSSSYYTYECLEDHTARTSASPRAPHALAGSLIAAATGATLCLIGSGTLFPVLDPPIVGPIAQSFGLLFVVAGVRVLGAVGFDRYRYARHRRLLLERPQEPWMADHPWSRDGERSDDLYPALHLVEGALFMKIFLMPFEYLAFGEGMGAWVWTAAVVLFSASIVWMLVLAARVLARRWASGTPRIRFEEFPMLLGQKVRVRLECSRALRRCRSLCVTLRCIEEQYIFGGEDGGGGTACVAYYTESRELPVDSWRSASGPVTIEMDLPAWDLPTKLLERPPRYWTLTLHGDAPWLDFYAEFLLPVYWPAPLQQA